MFSGMKQVTKASDLVDMINLVISGWLEGLELKDVKGTYEPRKQHWMKVNKDYINEWAMADTTDPGALGPSMDMGVKAA